MAECVSGKDHRASSRHSALRSSTWAGLVRHQSGPQGIMAIIPSCAGESLPCRMRVEGRGPACRVGVSSPAGPRPLSASSPWEGDLGRWFYPRNVSSANKTCYLISSCYFIAKIAKVWHDNPRSDANTRTIPESNSVSIAISSAYFSLFSETLYIEFLYR